MVSVKKYRRTSQRLNAAVDQRIRLKRYSGRYESLKAIPSIGFGGQ
jgi:hypothetical protein